MKVEPWLPHAHLAGAVADFSPEPIKFEPLNAETDRRALDRDITPAPAFFIRSNFAVPELSDSHVIGIGGEVEHPLGFSALELERLPQKSLTVTLECAGNDRSAVRPLPVGEAWRTGAVATAVWTGVPLKTLLDRAGVKKHALEVLFEGADGDDQNAYARALPIDKARHPDTLLAIAMNGAPLSRAHGAPVRLIVPGWYGMASVKWVRQLTVLQKPFSGHFQTDKYVYDPADGRRSTPVREMKVKSFISTPAESSTVEAGTVTLKGFAWSGAAKISRVEVAVGGGDAWTPATLGTDLGPWAWRPFSIDVKLPPGRHALRCRATDEAKNTQPNASEWNRLGYGNNGVRTMLIDAR